MSLVTEEVGLKIAILLGTLAFIPVCAASLRVSDTGQPAGLVQYTDGGELVRPQGYREWIFVSSGMRLSDKAPCGEGATFTNVFVDPHAYHQFLTTGSWTDKTVLVEEKRTASNKGSLNKGAQFQTDLVGISVKVKDAARFPEKWAYFSFDSTAKTAKANPKAMCWQCHHDQGAVDSTYVQFYPTLKPVAQKFGTLRQAATGAEAY